MPLSSNEQFIPTQQSLYRGSNSSLKLSRLSRPQNSKVLNVNESFNPLILFHYINYIILIIKGNI